MVDQPAKIREVAWTELFPWLILVRAVRIALMARVILLGALGIVATVLGWWLLSELFARSNDPVINFWQDVTNYWVTKPFWVDISSHSAHEVILSATEYLIHAPVAIWQFMTRPFLEMFHGDRTASGFVFLLLCGIWELLVWGLVGGAITRIAALKFTRDEAPGIIAALKHAARKLPSYSLPPLVAIIWAGVFAVQLVVIGFAMRLDFFALLAGIFWPFVLLLGLLMAILLLGALAGWPLMWATVSVEGTDAFDALSRSFAYTYHRPLRLLWYVLFAGLLAVISMFVVKLFASSAIALGDWSVDWGLDAPTMESVVNPRAPLADIDALPPPTEPTDAPAIETDAADVVADDVADTADADTDTDDDGAPDGLSGMQRAARWFILRWKLLVAALAAGYQAGFLWVAAVGVYLLMRRDIDGVQLNEVYVDPADEYGLPPLADEATSGVPEVIPGQPAPPGSTAP
jgi:hypothetical protein